MPELPEVETVRSGLAPVLESQRLEQVDVNRPDLRFPFPDQFAERLEGRCCTALGRRSKYLLMDLDDGSVVVMHLGMSGSFRVVTAEEARQPGSFHHERSKNEAHDHVVFHLKSGDRVIYNDPRRFGFMDLIRREDLPEHKFFRALGVEPTGNALGADYLAARFAGRKAPLKSVLLDQSIIAGLGNIYVCESLWRSGLAPDRAAATLVRKDGKPRKSLITLTGHIRAVIADAIAAGGSSLKDYVHADGSLGYFQHSFSVYDRENEPCRTEACDGVINRMVQSGRSTFYCPSCQK
ncbi:bifunctional DNA-formamidopyrimidine glycosylase/DNA-(apurinic or apyrimidinic site) lyase [Coralliovum pocilloporae]|uniref:bifunctional DNA-formamidopyrimidine glycosylase/DNA-(apurinic or apyrimidinic site) lyase n=1 Tax=Coralliovum pocilloporae TaxID=3066369 RepID=UPI003307B2B8